ncbi:hypothetical protein [Aliarcobacter butzleri]|uniref:hypothetical protein n=1 Tax=Aliarcobacter butzleri TaxID=28197 RepID=UPI0021B308E7|nr:hypothetical protein [Aliarcobacter butzleri]MCT7649210.1 hypothetical protein [Aliarcobacter butzleri]
MDGTSYNYAPDLIGNNKSILAHSSEWKNGKKNGLDKEFYLGGYPSCENYIGNIRTEINYLNDIRKYTKVFSCNGNLYKYIYEKNSNGIIKVEEYFPNGNVEIEIPFIEFNFNNIKNSIVDGEIKVFYENGNLNALINVNKEEYMNYKNATVKVFYNNGNLGREFIVQDKKVIEGYNYTREGKKIKMTMAHLHNYSNLNSNPLILDE